jgi:hypothetical protein
MFRMFRATAKLPTTNTTRGVAAAYRASQTALPSGDVQWLYIDAPDKSPGREIGPQHVGCLYGNQRNMWCRNFANRTFVVGVYIVADRSAIRRFEPAVAKVVKTFGT